MSTRDYKNTGRQRKREHNGPSRWVWFISGFSTGLVVAYVAYLQVQSPQTLKLVASQSALREEAQRQQKEPGTEDRSKPRFEFYTLLPEMEVAVPEQELQAAAREQQERTQQTQGAPPLPEPSPPAPAAASTASTPAAPPPPVTAPVTQITVTPPAMPAPMAAREEGSTTVPPPTAGALYMLQVASVTSMADADRLKASLTLLGLDASIQTVSVDGNATFYRVRVGPYADIARLNDARTRLRENSMEALVLKVKG